MSATAKPDGKRPKNCFATPGSRHWHYEITIQGHKERGSTGCSKAPDAVAFIAARRVAIAAEIAAQNSGRGRAKGAITLVDACQRYEDDKVSAQKAAVTYRGQLAFLVALFPENIELREIDHAALLDYRRDRKAASKRELRGATINREIELLRRVWRHADDLGYQCGDEPKWSKAIDRGSEVQRIRDLSESEEARLMAALRQINPDLALVAEFALICGQRKTAIMTLQRSRVDLKARSATIILKSKGDAPKLHTFPLTARAVEIIQSFPVIDGTDQVFSYECRRPAPARKDRPARIKGDRYPFSVGGWARDWKRAKEDAGVSDFRFHDLRHTTATRIIRRTGNLKVAQNLLAHSDIAQTSRYAHAFHDDILAAMEQVAA